MAPMQPLTHPGDLPALMLCIPPVLEPSTAVSPYLMVLLRLQALNDNTNRNT